MTLKISLASVEDTSEQDYAVLTQNPDYITYQAACTVEKWLTDKKRQNKGSDSFPSIFNKKSVKKQIYVYANTAVFLVEIMFTHCLSVSIS